MCTIETRDSFFDRLKGNFSIDSIGRIGDAYRLAKDTHRRQRRDGGERYFEHPRSVALIIFDELYIYDEEMIITALLHDSLEDGWLRPETIETLFGTKIKDMVCALSKWSVEERNGKILKTKRDDYEESLLSADWKTRVVKLCDRLHNIRTLGSCTPEKRNRVLSETASVYMPLAMKTSKYIFELLSKELESAVGVSVLLDRIFRTAPHYLSGLRSSLEPIKSLVPKGMKLLSERVVFPDEVPVFATWLILVRQTNNPIRFDLVKGQLEVRLSLEEDARNLIPVVKEWLEEKAVGYLPFEYVTQESRDGKVVYIPNDMPIDYKYYGDDYAFEEVFKD